MDQLKIKVPTRPLQLIMDFIHGDGQYWKPILDSSLHQLKIIGNLLRTLTSVTPTPSKNTPKKSVKRVYYSGYTIPQKTITTLPLTKALTLQRNFNRNLFDLLSLNSKSESFWNIDSFQRTRHDIIKIDPKNIIKRRQETIRYIYIYYFELSINLQLQKNMSV